MTTLSWEAAEFKEHNKPKTWYIVFALISLALVGYAIYQKSVITTIMFILLAVVSLVFALKKPDKLAHKITGSGIIVGDVLYSYKTIKNFWILYNPPEVKTLNFETTAYLNRVVVLQLGSQDPIEVKLALKNYLPEDLDREESLSDKLARNLKF